VESLPGPGEGGNTRYREITVGAITFAVIVGVVMNAAITYAGLKIGFTIAGSAVAAVLGFGILRGVFRKGSILEINIAQTVASAVNISNSGVIFTVPVLLLIGYTLTASHLDFWMIMGACIAGAMLGTAFIIPLRKQMLDIERLRFPSATAVASILKSPGAGSAKAIVLLVGIAVGALIYFPTQLTVFDWPGLSELPGLGVSNGGFVGDDRLDIGFLIGLPAQFHFVFAIAPFALGAGYLTGRPGLYVLAGLVLQRVLAVIAPGGLISVDLVGPDLHPLEAEEGVGHPADLRLGGLSPGRPRAHDLSREGECKGQRQEEEEGEL